MDALDPGAWAVLIASVALAGLTRGFAGFGTAMIYMPVAGAVMPPVWALVTLIVMDLFGPIPNLPRAIRDGAPRDMIWLMGGMLVGLPLGIYTLGLLTPEVFRYAVSIIALILLALLVGGVRYQGRLTGGLLAGTGGIGGVLLGCTGLAGPPVIMLYMASRHAASVIRANLLVFLFLSDILLLAMFGGMGMLTWAPVQIGLILAVPNMLANIAGAAMFNPAREVTYRRVAYIIIAVSALSGLPFWD